MSDLYIIFSSYRHYRKHPQENSALCYERCACKRGQSVQYFTMKFCKISYYTGLFQLWLLLLSMCTATVLAEASFKIESWFFLSVVTIHVSINTCITHYKTPFSAHQQRHLSFLTEFTTSLALCIICNIQNTINL